MTVRELIENLEQLNQDTEIFIEGYEFGKILTYDDIDEENFYVIEGKTWKY